MFRTSGHAGSHTWPESLELSGTPFVPPNKKSWFAIATAPYPARRGVGEPSGSTHAVSTPPAWIHTPSGAASRGVTTASTTYPESCQRAVTRFAPPLVHTRETV